MKYDKLWKYIKNKDVREITFKEIEEILGFKINHAFFKWKKEFEKVWLWNK